MSTRENKEWWKAVAVILYYLLFGWWELIKKLIKCNGV